MKTTDKTTASKFSTLPQYVGQTMTATLSIGYSRKAGPAVYYWSDFRLPNESDGWMLLKGRTYKTNKNAVRAAMLIGCTVTRAI